MQKIPKDIFNILGSDDPQKQKQTAMQMLSGLDENQSKKIKEIMSDQKKISDILSSPEAQQILNKLKGK